MHIIPSCNRNGGHPLWFKSPWALAFLWIIGPNGKETSRFVGTNMREAQTWICVLPTQRNPLGLCLCGLQNKSAISLSHCSLLWVEAQQTEYQWSQEGKSFLGELSFLKDKEENASCWLSRGDHPGDVIPNDSGSRGYWQIDCRSHQGHLGLAEWTSPAYQKLDQYYSWIRNWGWGGERGLERHSNGLSICLAQCWPEFNLWHPLWFLKPHQEWTLSAKSWINPVQCWVWTQKQKEKKKTKEFSVTGNDPLYMHV